MDLFDPWPPSDPLGEALHLLRVSGAYYCRSEVTAPWGSTLPPMPGYLWFHVVTEGRAVLDTDDGEVRVLEPGDLTLVLHGAGHRLRSDLDADAPSILDQPVERISDRYEVLYAGGGGAPTTMLCGAVRVDDPTARRLVQVLPPTIHVGASTSASLDWLPATFRMLAAEARTLRPGGEAVITRLGDILVIQAIRTWMATDPEARRGWLGALRDPQVGRALTAVHREPERDWTVASLAQEAAMSRSAFAARFSELVGEPPMTYLARARMQVARVALQEEGATVASLARRLGYRSEAAFSRAFKRIVGVPPAAVKRAAGATGPAEADRMLQLAAATR